MNKNLLNLARENQETLSQTQLDYNEKMTKLFQESGELIVEIFELSNTIKEQEKLKKSIDEELTASNFFDMETGEEELTIGENIFKKKLVNTKKLDPDKIKKLAEQNEIEVFMKEPTMDETKMKKLYVNKDIYKQELQLICYSPKLLEIDQKVNSMVESEQSTSEVKELKKQNEELKKLMEQVAEVTNNFKQNKKM